MLKRFGYWLGWLLAVLMWCAAFIVVAAFSAVAPQPQHAPALFAVPFAVVSGGIAVAVVAHELGHLLACLAVGAQVRALRIGSHRHALKFRVREVYVSLGFPRGGHVEYDGAFSVWRRAVITVAGSLADLALAGLMLALLPASPWARAIAVAVAVTVGVTGVTNLLPFRTRNGTLSDGARLFELRKDVRQGPQRTLLLTALRLKAAGRAAQLRKLHAEQGVLSGTLAADQAQLLVMVEDAVASLPELPADAIALAERRLAALAPLLRGSKAEAATYLILARLRLREGRLREVEPMAQQALAVAPAQSKQGSVLAAAAALTCVARQALGLPYEDALAGAGVPRSRIERAMAELWWTLSPGQMLAAVRDGDLMARVTAGCIASYLRGQGRVAELLELHAWIAGTREELTSGPHAAALLHSIHSIEDALLLVPGIPADVVEVAANRIEFALDHFPFESVRPFPHYEEAMEHTLALARLRQGRYKEVEQLCRPGLKAALDRDSRATVLATVVLARRGRGKSYRGLLTEATFLAPDADLVLEASLEPNQAAGPGRRAGQLAGR